MKRFLSVILMMTFLLSLMPTGLFSITVSAETTGSYTITYHLDGGTNAIKNPDVYTAEDTITLMPATKVGYDFTGWFLDANKTEQVTQISGTGDIHVYAKFTPKIYEAIFNDNGADQSSTLKVTLNDSIGNTKVYSLSNSKDLVTPYIRWHPTRSGYVFAGWYDGDQLIPEKLNITSDIVLNAKWTQCSKHSDGEKFAVFGENTSVLKSSDNHFYKYKYEGYSDAEYLGWDDSAYSQWSSGWSYVYVYVDGKYKTLNYEGVSGDYYHDQNVIEQKEAKFEIYDVTNEKMLVKSSYDYLSVKTSSGSFEVEPGSILRVGVGYYISHSYLTPKWGEIKISAGDYRSSLISPAHERTAHFEFDSYISAPSVSKTGYKFLGWYDSQGNQMTETWQYTGDQTFTAKWQPLNCDITYELDGGINSPSNPFVYTIEDTITLKDPTKPGYTFKGWYSDADFKTQVTSISKKTGNITLYAKWEVNSYNLTLDADTGVFAPKVTFISDGVEVKSCYLYEQDTITAYRPTGKDGYIFAGWYTDDTFTSLFKFNGIISNDITLYAKWIECNSNIVNVEFAENLNTTIRGKAEQLYAFVPLVDGKITVTSESNNLDLYGILYDTNKSILVSSDDISNMDLDFTYTYNVKAGQLYYIAVKGNTASTSGQATIDIAWNGNCTITGTTYQNRQLTVAYDSNYKLPQKPVREGYVFLGWFDENDTQITDGIWNFVTDKTLTAKWEEATYHTVVFKDLDGNIISSETYYLSENIVAPELPTKAPDNTYIYHAKWDNDYTGICTGDAVYSPTFDAEYIEYTVVFVDEDGTELSRDAYHWGDVVIPPDTPTKDIDANYANAYAFAGWDNTVVNCAGDATYTATYTAVPLKELVLTSQPDQLRYRTGESLNLAGLTLRLAYSDGASVFLDSVDAQFVSADLSTSGRKVVTITIAGVSTQFEIYVHDVEEVDVTVDSSLYPQSSHNYSNNLDETKTFTYPGAQSLVITFNSQTSVENNYDYIYIYDGAGNQIAKYTGTTAANKTLTITGDTFKVRLTSDSSNVKYGYAFSSIQAHMGTVGEIIHQPVIDPATVTCTQDGLTEGSHCDICGDILVAQEEVAALGHDYKTVFIWSENHTACTVVITCERACGLYEVAECTVTHNEPNQEQTAHTAVVEHNGTRFTDVLTCDNFLITFKDWDGTQISSTYYHVGDSVIVPVDPVRVADNTYTYTFAGWDKTVVDCVGDATYTATYISNYIDYTVVFKNWDGTVISEKVYHYGDKVTAPVNPTKEADNTYSYSFAGWDKDVVDCVGDATYTATYTSNYIDYTVVFKNWDGSVISEKVYHYGDKVTAPVNPTKEADNTYSYSFAGWDKEVVDCIGDVTYTAVYTPTYRNYLVMFKNQDGTVLFADIFKYGDKVSIPFVPVKEADETYTYTFAGWDKPVVDCVGNETYIAIYTADYIDYTVVFKNWDGSVISEKVYHYGDKVTAPANPTRPSDGNYIYTFNGWDKEVTSCNGNVVYTATYSRTELNFTSIVITSMPNKVVYHDGEEFDESGMVVKAYYSDGSSEVVTDYTISGYTSTPGTKVITVTYGELTTTFTVNVLARRGDVNGDGRTNSSDALLILQYSVGKITEINSNYADANHDGRINSSDALIALQISVGNYSGDLWFDIEDSFATNQITDVQPILLNEEIAFETTKIEADTTSQDAFYEDKFKLAV